MKSQYETHLVEFSEKYGLNSLVKDKTVFIPVDKYNKPLDTTTKSKTVLTATQKEQLEQLKTYLPYEDTYFNIYYDSKNNVFLLRRKTPVQSMLNIWAISLILWALYRAYFKTDLPIWIDEFFIKPLVFIGPAFYYITHSEKKDFLGSIGLQKKISFTDILVGVSIGALFIVAGVAGYYVKYQHVTVQSMFSHASEPWIVLVLLCIATAISEEILSRGFVLKRLYEDSKNPYTATLYTSILFFFLHVPILFVDPALTGTLLLQTIVTDFLLSIINSLLFISSGSLYLPIIVHTLYNLSLYLFTK